MNSLIGEFPPDQSLVKMAREIAKKQEHMANYKATLQARCKHEKVFECPHRRGLDFAHASPERKCCNCLLREEEWGTGYKELRNPKVIVPVSRYDFFSIRETSECFSEAK